MSVVLVVDDSPVDRRLVAGLLSTDRSLAIEVAENGVEALQRLEDFVIDLVVTDLQMPDLDGLGLIRAMRSSGTTVPVIVMTAHGSEDMAWQALQAGAASYVPKTHLADMLCDTVAKVLTLTSADRTSERLSRCQSYSLFRFELENEPKLIDPLVERAQEECFRMGLCDPTGRFRIGMALQQALLNALFHGNLELNADQLQHARRSLLGDGHLGAIEQRRREKPFCDRRIFVEIEVSHDQAKFTIRDEGPGFEIAKQPVAGAINLEGGRGLRLMRTFMDEVQYNDRGNQVTMLKHRETQHDTVA